MASDPVPVVAALALALGPFLILTAAKVRGGAAWKAFVFGIAGWALALVLRIVPLQLPVAFLGEALLTDVAILLAFGAFASLLAGIFEEGIRYGLMRRVKSLRTTILAFGLGWGIGEALLIYVPAIATLWVMGQAPPFLEMLPGAIERNLAIALHVSLAFIIAASLKNRKLLVLAIFLHFFANVVAITTATVTENVWLAEGFLGVVVMASVLIAMRLRPEWKTISTSKSSEKR